MIHDPVVLREEPFDMEVAGDVRLVEHGPLDGAVAPEHAATICAMAEAAKSSQTVSAS